MLWADDVTFWSSVSGAAGTGLAGGIAVILFFLRKTVKAKYEQWEESARLKRDIERQKHADYLDKNWMILSRVERLCELPGVDRVMVFRGSNGGGLPRVDTPYRITCLYGHSSDDAKDPAKLYEGPLRVDAAYMKMVAKMAGFGVVTMTTEKMRDGTMLKAFYKKEGVVQSRLYFLALSPTRLIYCSVASYTHEFSVDELALIDAAVNLIRGHLDTDATPLPPPTLNTESDEWMESQPKPAPN